MKIEIPRPLAAEVLRLAEAADRIEGYTNERPKDPLTRLVDALRPCIVDAKEEEVLMMRDMDAADCPGDPYYELETDDPYSRSLEAESAEDEPAPAPSSPEQPKPSGGDAEPMPF